jgi:hypothetical protein
MKKNPFPPPPYFCSVKEHKDHKDNKNKDNNDHKDRYRSLKRVGERQIYTG